MRNVVRIQGSQTLKTGYGHELWPQLSRTKEGRIEREDTGRNQCLPSTKLKPQAGDRVHPTANNLHPSAENNVVPINANQVIGNLRPGHAITKGNIVLETEKRKAQEISHQLPPNLPKTTSPPAGERVLHVRTKRTPSQIEHTIWDKECPLLENTEDNLGNLQWKIVRRGLVISADENLPLLTNKVRKLGLLGFTTKKPRTPVRKNPVNETVQRTQ